MLALSVIPSFLCPPSPPIPNSSSSSSSPHPPRGAGTDCGVVMVVYGDKKVGRRRRGGVGWGEGGHQVVERTGARGCGMQEGGADAGAGGGEYLFIIISH